MAESFKPQIRKLHNTNEKLKNIILSKPSFKQPTDEKNLIDPSWQVGPGDVYNFENNKLSFVFGQGVYFSIQGIPVLQWERGQSIGAALKKSTLAARKALVRELETTLKYTAVRMTRKAFTKIMGQQASGIKKHVPEKNVEQEEFVQDNWYPKESMAQYDIEDRDIVSENVISNTPQRLRNTSFKNDLQTPITIEKRLANLPKKSHFPFYFKDLRGSKENCFFNAFMENISEDISANWNKSEFYGRTEGIAKYINTEWTISMTFSIVCEWPSDIDYMYKKINWLKKMNYPEYNDKGNMDNAPLLKFTLGNLFYNLGGYLTGLSIDYDLDGGWETKDGKQLPKKADINLTYNVIQEELPSRDTDFYSNVNFDKDLVFYK